MNNNMLLSIPDEFISKDISSRVDIKKDDSSERKSYKTNLVKNNEKNNLYHTIGSAGINESRILSSCIYIDVNKFKQNLYLKLISAIYNISDDNIAEDYNNEPRPVISYNLYNNGKSLND